MRALINAFIVHLTLNILVFLKGWHTFDKQKWARVVLVVLFGSELLIYVIGFIFYKHISEQVNQLIRVMGTSWMLFLFYTGGLWMITDLIYIIIRKHKRKPWSFKDQSQSYKITTFLGSVLIVISVMIYGNYKFQNPEVQQVNITIKKPIENIDSLRIAVIGDLHLGWMTNKNQTKRYVDLIMEQEPDLILFVGDIMDSHIEPVIERGMDVELSKLSAPYGVFSCTGNHEYRYEAEEKIKLLNNAGIIMLRDSAAFIDSSFYVIGREDRIIINRKSTLELLKEHRVNKLKPIIILNHTPDNIDEEVNAGVDIALYGHTHHGQAFPGNIATELIFEVAYGYKKKENTHIYVTSGIGLVGPQYRIGTVSEIVILTVKFQEL